MSTGRVHAKVALVTGAGSGIGRATAVLLAEEGATVIVSDADSHAADRVASEILKDGLAVVPVGLDVADECAWAAAIEAILALHRRLDVLVNNAGVSFVGPVADTTLDEWRRVLSINLDGVFLGTRSAVRAMGPGGGGSIINVASVSGINAYPGASAYGASKAAVRLFSKAAAIKCADAGTGIRVNVVTPGGVKTPMWEAMDFFKELVAAHGGTEGAFAAHGGRHAVAPVLLAGGSRPDHPLPGVGRVLASDRGRACDRQRPCGLASHGLGIEVPGLRPTDPSGSGVPRLLPGGRKPTIHTTNDLASRKGTAHIREGWKCRQSATIRVLKPCSMNAQGPQTRDSHSRQGDSRSGAGGA